MYANIMPPRRRLTGLIAAIVTMAALVGVMFPLRHHLAIAVVALVLVVPVVLGVVLGGFAAGLVTVLVGFLTYDLLFIPPYGTLNVGRAENWAALGVYVAVMLLVSRVVDRLWRTETASRESEQDTSHLFQLSELLVADRPAPELFRIIVQTVREAFGLSAVVLLLPPSSAGGAGAAVPAEGDATGSVLPAASEGRELRPEELARIVPAAGATSTLRPSSVPPGGTGEPAEQVEAVVLSVADRTVGLLAIAGPPLPPRRRELLSAFANHIALAVERAQLREQALRVGILEEVDHHRRSLLRAVSHDLRTPLATIKASASALMDPRLALGDGDRAELARLIESRSDRLERVVSNLLDLSRIQAGVLVLDLETITLGELLASVREALGPDAARVSSEIAPGLPPITVDRTLVVEALVNVLENAIRYSPEDEVVLIRAALCRDGGEAVSVTVSDRGPGMSAADRSRVFGLLAGEPSPSPSVSGGTGLGLSIAKAFVDAHEGTISIESADPGTRVVVELPVRPLSPSDEVRPLTVDETR